MREAICLVTALLLGCGASMEGEEIGDDTADVETAVGTWRIEWSWADGTNANPLCYSPRLEVTETTATYSTDDPCGENGPLVYVHQGWLDPVGCLYVPSDAEDGRHGYELCVRDDGVIQGLVTWDDVLVGRVSWYVLGERL